jgi:hypothetical protein
MTAGHTLHGMSWIVPPRRVPDFAFGQKVQGPGRPAAQGHATPSRPKLGEVLREIGLLIAAHAVVVLAILLILRAVVPAVPM